MNLETDRLLLDLHAEVDGVFTLATAPGDGHRGADEVAHGYQKTGMLPWHPHGPRRQIEDALKELVAAGLVQVSGQTQGRRCGLTWPGYSRAVCVTVGKGELQATLTLLKRMAHLAATEAGSDWVSPAGEVPDFMLEPALGTWWANPDQQAWSMLTCRMVTALALGWATFTPDAHGGRWWMLTESGKAVVACPPKIPNVAENKALFEHYLPAVDGACQRASKLRPKDDSVVTRHRSTSRWWKPSSLSHTAAGQNTPANPA